MNKIVRPVLAALSANGLSEDLFSCALVLPWHWVFIENMLLGYYDKFQ